MNDSLRIISLVGVFAGGLALGAACSTTEINQSHCARQDGDATCRELHPGEFEFCGGDCVDSEDNDGCVAQMPEPSCWYPCGDNMNAEDDMSCIGMTMTDTLATTMDTTETDPSGEPTTDDTATTMGSMTQGSETDASTTEGGGDCQTSADCMDADFPVCLDNDCVPCTGTPDGDMACAAKDDTMPVCNDAGQCVQCNAGNATACTDTTPVCDEDASTCVGCTYHEQCSDTACDIATGACFDDLCIAEVDDVGAPFDNISDAIGEGCVVIVHDAPGGYAESVQISGIKVAILAADGASPLVLGVGGNALPSLQVTDGAEVYVQGLRLNGNDMGGVGIAVDNGDLYLDRSEVVANTGGGLVLVGGGAMHVRNSIVGGDATSGLPAVSIDSSAANLLYTTAVGVGIGGQALSCTDPGAVDVRNALLFTQDGTDPMDCAGATVSTTAAEVAIPGDDNVAVAGFMTTAFANFGMSNFKLGAGAPAAILSAARWRTADPLADPPRPADDPATDIDGQLRPSTDDAEDVAGADIPE